MTGSMKISMLRSIFLALMRQVQLMMTKPIRLFK